MCKGTTFNSKYKINESKIANKREKDLCTPKDKTFFYGI